MTKRPYMIPFAYPIGVMLSFQDGYAQLAAEFVVDSAGEFYNEEGKWGAGGEAFFGIRTKRDEHYYYGWIRATVADSAKSITLHDYAYETIADKTIIAGDSLGTMSVSTSSLQPINITCNGTTLFIQTNASYNINLGQLSPFVTSISRDLHCWQMSITVVPTGAWRSFSINISPKSGILRDLRVNKTETFRQL